MQETDRPVGIVIGAWSGWYEVSLEGRSLLCRPRGRMRPRGSVWRQVREREHGDAMAATDEGDAEADARWERRAPHGAGPRRAEGEADFGAVLAGDRVRCTDLGDGEGRIEAVLPRRNVLPRPPVANVDLVLIVTAWAEPPFSFAYVDRLLVAVRRDACEAVLCLNKADLLTPDERTEAETQLAAYRTLGVPVVLTSARDGEGIEEARSLLRSRLGVLAGPSGVGKSALLSRICPERLLRSAALSARLGRGRHTTRHTELLPLAGAKTDGWVADTPGFSRLDLEDLDPADLGAYYPEFAAVAQDCHFHGCLHDGEPGCAIAEAVASGRIDVGRHERYRALLAEVRERFRVF